MCFTKFKLMERWPNFFIVGAPKSGTTSLFAYLKTVPDIFMPEIKEPNFFSIVNVPEDSHTKPIRDRKKYLELFKKVKDEKIIGEASVSYLSDPQAPKLIHKVSPNAKILISLRDPVERAHSNYLHLKRLGRVNFSFNELLHRAAKEGGDDYKANLGLYGGLYSENVKRYVDTFGSNQVKILIFEEWIKDAKNTVEEILEFLGIDFIYDDFKEEVYNKFGIARGPIAQALLRNKKLKRFAKRKVPSPIRRFVKQKVILKSQPKPKMDKDDIMFLVDFYRKDVEELKKNVGKKISWKNFTD